MRLRIKRSGSFLLFPSVAMFPYLAIAGLTPKSHLGHLGIDIQGQVDVGYGVNSNVTYQAEQTPASQATESDYVRIQPWIQAIGQRGEDRYLFRYTGDYSRYNDSLYGTAQSKNNHADNTTDHLFRFRGQWRLGLKHGVVGHLSQVRGHEARGQGSTEGFALSQFNHYGIDHPLKTAVFSSDLGYHYGALKGRGELAMTLSTKTLRFRETDTIEDAFLAYLHEQEWRENSLRVALRDQYSSATQLNYALLTTQRHYAVNALKDTNEYVVMLGLKSQRSEKTSIEATMSWLSQTFPNNSASRRFQGMNWGVNVRWQPVRHTAFKLAGQQSVGDPTEQGGYILKTKLGGAWIHHWGEARLSTQIGYHHETDAYHIAAQNRQDNIQQLKAMISYDFRPSIRCEFSYQYNQKKSNQLTESFFIGPAQNEAVTRTLGYEQRLVQLMIKVQL